MSFRELFQALKCFGLYCYPRDEVRRLRSLSTSLCLDYLELLSLAEADYTKDNLATLVLQHGSTLNKIHLDMIDIVNEEGS